MFLRSTPRKKDGKIHRYFSVVENRRLPGAKTVQRTVLYLGEINDQQQTAWRKTLEVFCNGSRSSPARFSRYSPARFSQSLSDAVTDLDAGDAEGGIGYLPV